MADRSSSRSSRRSNTSALLWLLGILFLLGALCTLGGCTVLLLNPYAGFNPFPPPTLPPTLELPPTETPPPYPTLPPTWTPTVTMTFTPLPTATPTPLPTATLPPTVTPTLPPTATLAASATPGGSGPTPTPLPFFALQPGNPAYQSSQVFHPDAGCNWLSVGGQVLEANGAPAPTDPPMFVVVRGLLAGQPVDQLALVGQATHFGPAGYEAKLGDAPVASSQAVYVQLVDINGYALSDPFFFDTYDDCQRNVVIMNFVRQR
ncbi:MAG: hypothetical protein GXO37_03435 [Chloroflexi bacterium]|nr:hypothetical protein [Chloroflexota bacterium]